MTSSDAQTIDICRHLLFIHHEEEALVEQDPYAPDRGPNHERHKALLAEYATLAAALTKAAPPSTTEGREVLAQLAMTLVARDADGNIPRPDDFADWVMLSALSSAAGNPETIPLPNYLPRYWAAE